MLFVLVIVAFFSSIFLAIFSGMKSTDVYKTALSRAQAEPAVIEALGTPIKDGFLFTGSTHVNGASGDADMGIPISGPKGKGTIYVVATKSAGRWSYTTLEVEIAATKQRVPLDTSPTVD